ncbi:MAG TPA: hypothetical protein VMS37_16480 [Verrucomicrobiae bacterium]|nr:hypothetical protein [Verrucomicrobiae bacterium]
MEKAASDTRATSSSRCTASLKKTLHLAVKFRHRGIVCLAPWIDDDCPLWAQLVQMQAHCLSQTPFDAISHHGLAERARHRETDARTVTARLPYTEGGEDRAAVAGAFIVNSSEIS